MKNRYLLLKCISMGALSFPTPFFLYFFALGIDTSEITYEHRFLLMSVLLLSGSLVGLAFYYKDSAVAALKDWYPSEKKPAVKAGPLRPW